MKSESAKRGPDPLPGAPGSWQDSRRWVWLYAVVIVAAAAYFNTLGAGFAYDDGTFIVRNQTLRTLTPISKFFTSTQAYAADGRFAIYRPLSALSFALNLRFAGIGPDGKPDPWGFHLVNLLSHAAVAGVLYLLLMQVFRRAAPAGLGAMLFAVHPVNTEAVAWISGRCNPFFLFFLLLGFLLHVKLRQDTRRFGTLYPGMLAAYGMALLGKEHAIVLPVLLLAYDLTLDRRGSRKIRELVVYYVPMLVMAGGYVLWRHHVLGRTDQTDYYGSGFLATMYTMSKVFLNYLRVLFLPIGLSADYTIPVSESPLEPMVVVSILVLAALAVTAVLLWRRAPLLGFLVIWFFISLGPVSNVIPLQALQADRFLYLTTVAVGIGAAGLMSWLQSHRAVLWARQAAPTALGLAVVGVGLGFGLTVLRNRVWHGNLELWGASVAVNPASDRAHINYGQALFETGQVEKALAQWQEALKVNPQSPAAAMNLAAVYMKMNPPRLRDAEQMARLAVNVIPEQSAPHSLLGIILVNQGKTDEAEAECLQAIDAAKRQAKGAPGSEVHVPDSELTLALLYLGPGRSAADLEKAIPLLEGVVRYGVEPETVKAASVNLVMAYRRAGRTDQAVALARDALRKLPPGDPLAVEFRRQLSLMGAPQVP